MLCFQLVDMLQRRARQHTELLRVVPCMQASWIIQAYDSLIRAIYWIQMLP